MPRINRYRGDSLYDWPEIVEEGAQDATDVPPVATSPEDHDPLAEEIFDLAVFEAIDEYAPTIEVVPEPEANTGERP